MTQDTGQVSELLPCPTPWCTGKGGEPYVFERRRDCLGVYCPSCNVSTDYHPTREAGIAQWNARPQPEAALTVGDGELVERYVGHSPGPWLIDGPLVYSGERRRVGKVAEVSIAYKDSITYAANGRLIADAPALLDRILALNADNAALSSRCRMLEELVGQAFNEGWVCGSGVEDEPTMAEDWRVSNARQAISADGEKQP